MTRRILATGLFCCLLDPTISFAKDRFLQGRVLLVGEQDELSPLVGQDVAVAESGDRARTKEVGRFRIFLKDIYKPGTRITLSIEKKGYRIQYPLDGEARVPDDLGKELVEIRLLPVGSKKFWSADRIEKFIKDTADKAKEQIRPEGKPEDMDFSRYIKDWAVTYGFSAQQAKAEIDKWVAETEKKNDPYQLGLAAYAKKNFGEAGKLFEESAVDKVRRAQEASATAQQLTEEAIRDYRLAGDAHTSNYHFDQARIAYESARKLISPTDQPWLWADFTINVGTAEAQIGIRTKGDNIHLHLGNAVAAYRAALTVRTKEQLPQNWAITQNNLGNVLRDQGIRTAGDAGTQLLAQAVDTYRAALEIRTKEHLPQDWTQTHNNLARAALLLEDWQTVAESYRNVLTRYPDYTEAYQIANAVYHEKLFAYASAFDLTKQWVDRHPKDVSAQANFAEAHVTTGRYGEAERRLGTLLKKSDLDSSSAVGLRVVETVNALALKKSNAVPQKLRELRIFVSEQPESFHVEWSFDGTKHYVQTEQLFAQYRTWLNELFEMVKSENRAGLLTAIDRVEASFRP